MKETTLQQYKERMLRVLVYIQQHMDDELELERAAARLSVPPRVWRFT